MRHDEQFRLEAIIVNSRNHPCHKRLYALLSNGLEVWPRRPRLLDECSSLIFVRTAQIDTSQESPLELPINFE